MSVTPRPADAAPAAGLRVWVDRVQAGLISGVLATIFAISSASLISGAVGPQITATVIGLALVGTAVLCVVLGAFGQIKGAMPLVQDVPSAALAAILVATLAARDPSASPLSTGDVVALCLLAGVALALALWLLGTFRLAMVMRFVPRPVLAGFLAGTGYFVTVGALGICLGTVVTLPGLAGLVQAPALGKFAVAIGVAVALVLANRLMRSNLATSAVFGLGLVVFHGAVLVFGLDIAALQASGWFIALPPGGLPWPPLKADDIAGIDWQFLSGQLLPLATMVLLATAALLMNSSALEARLSEDLDLDREMKAVGLSNLLSAGLGGMPGYHGVVTTLSALRIAQAHRAISFVAGAVALLVFVQGEVLLAVLPLPLFAGFMLWVGLDMIREWLLDEFRRTPPAEAWLTLAIFAAIALFGLFQGTVFGLAAGSVLFIINYSRQNPVRTELYGDVYHGARELTAAERRVLREHGSAIAVLKLHGYVFFGTAHRVRERVRDLMRAKPIRYLVLDLDGVSGIDATAVATYLRIAQDVENAPLRLILTGLNPRVAETLQRAAQPTATDRPLETAADLNAGVSLCVDALLAEHMPMLSPPAAEVEGMLGDSLGNKTLAAELIPYLESVEMGPNEILIREGEAATDIYFVERGELDILIGWPEAPRPVRRIGPGAIVGEMSYYSGGTRTSTVRTAGAVRLWRFSSDISDRLIDEAPELASAFHAAIAAILAERVSANTRLIQMLQA